MSTAYEEAKAELDRLIDWHGEQSGALNRNESTTRFHLIDALLTQVLGWPKEEIETETPFGGEYVDYSLGRPATRLIVEAKREGQHFEIPIGLTTLVHRISSLVDGEGGKALKAAIEQAAGYCARRGVPLAAVCNGTQLVAFLGVRTDGVPPVNGVALAFTSLSAMRENFRLLWENLSRPGVEARNLHITLREGEAPSVPPPLSAQLPHYPGYKRRNDIQTGLQILADLFLEDITRSSDLQQEFLQTTYAASGALSQYAMVSKGILESRYSLTHEPTVDVEAEPVLSKRGLNPNLREDVVASSISRRPIILLGDVGVGKTMFIRRLIHVDAKEVFDKSIVLYVDFGSQPTLSGDLSGFVISEIESQLEHKYGYDVALREFVETVHRTALTKFDGTIYGELKQFDEPGYRRERLNFLASLVKDRESHLRASLNHIRATTGRHTVVFLDNIDQWDSDAQERVFLMAESLAANWPMTVFVTIRPDTFYRSRSEGTLAAYQPRAFTIAPPRVDVVLKKRIDFALRQLRDTSRLQSFPPGVTLSSDSLTAYLEILLENFERNTRLITMIDNLAAGNIRRALEFVSRFIGSGHVDTRKILGIYEREGEYTIPQHEFFRALIYGDNEFYDPDASPIANLFDVSHADGREHFLLALVIGYVEASGDRAGSEGYVRSDDVYTFSQHLGFGLEQIAWAIDRGSKKGLLERTPRGSDSKRHEHLRVTSAGVYTARILAGMFAYADAVVVDTPVMESQYRQRIGNVRDVGERLRRAEIFRLYLDREWRSLADIASDLPFDWDDHSRRLKSDVDEVQRRNTR